MTPKTPALLVKDLLSELSIAGLGDLDLIQIANHLGIEIRFEHLDGCAANIIGVGDKAIVTVDSTASAGRRRFSIAHEIGHWIYDKGKGVYLCETQDLNVPWNARTKTNVLEKRANRFAAELLMPKDWFRKAARNNDMSFATVGVLSKEFKSSRTSTAIRLVELGSCLAILVMFDHTGRRKWYCASRELPERFYPCRALPQDSRAYRDIVRTGAVESAIDEVDGDLWIDHPRAFELTVYEQAMRVGNNILAMVWLLDDRIIAEITEDDESGD